MAKNEFNTPNLDVLLQVAGKKAPLLCADAKLELEALRLLCAKELINNYCEVYGVPNEVMTDDPEKLIEWARNQHQRDLDG